MLFKKVWILHLPIPQSIENSAFLRCIFFGCSCHKKHLISQEIGCFFNFYGKIDFWKTALYLGILYLILTDIRYKLHERGGEMAHSQTMGILDGNIRLAVRIIAADIQFIIHRKILVDFGCQSDHRNCSAIRESDLTLAVLLFLVHGHDLLICVDFAKNTY